MTPVQYEAMVKLRGSSGKSLSTAAVRSVMVDGLSQKEAAQKHGLSYSTVSKAVWTFRQALALAVTVVTGQETHAPAERQGHPLSAQDPLRGFEGVTGNEQEAV